MLISCDDHDNHAGDCGGGFDVGGVNDDDGCCNLYIAPHSLHDFNNIFKVLGDSRPCLPWQHLEIILTMIMFLNIVISLILILSIS